MTHVICSFSVLNNVVLCKGNHFIHPTIDGHVSYFHFLATANNPTMSILIYLLGDQVR